MFFSECDCKIDETESKESHGIGLSTSIKAL